MGCTMNTFPPWFLVPGPVSHTLSARGGRGPRVRGAAMGRDVYGLLSKGRLARDAAGLAALSRAPVYVRLRAKAGGTIKVAQKYKSD